MCDIFEIASHDLVGYITLSYGIEYSIVSWGAVKMLWYGLAWYGLVWLGMVWFSMAWFSIPWYGLSLVWFSMVIVNRREGLETIRITISDSLSFCSGFCRN